MPQPAEAGDALDWAVVEADYGFPFPSDFRAFTVVYGDGSIDEVMSVLIPRRTPDDLWGIDRLPVEFLVRLFCAEFDECPINEMGVWGNTSPPPGPAPEKAR